MSLLLLFPLGGGSIPPPPDPEPPGQVTGLAAGTPTSSTVPLTWNAPASGGAPTDYVVEYKLSASPTWLVFSDGTSTATSTTVTGLSADSSYDFRVKATNALGDGAYSNTVTATTAAALAPPGNVTGLEAIDVASNFVSLIWIAPSTGGAVATYVVEYKASASPTWIEFSLEPTTAETVTGLAATTSYDFRVKARNAAGDGGYSVLLGVTTLPDTGTNFLLINNSGDRLLINGSGDKLKVA